MVGREVLLVHSETVATLRVHVQFGWLVSVGPLFVQSDAVRGQPQIVIGGRRDKHRRRIRWHGSILKHAPGGINQGGEGWPTIRRVTQCNSGGDRSTSGESNNAHTIGGNSPVRRVPPNIGDRRQPIGDRQGNDLI